MIDTIKLNSIRKGPIAGPFSVRLKSLASPRRARPGIDSGKAINID